MRYGAFGFVPKSHDRAQLLAAVAQILEGEVYLPEQIRQELERVSEEELDALENIAPASLTARQQAVLQLLHEGKSNKEIAAHLFLSMSTVKFHIAALFELLEAHSRTECISKATALGLIS